MKVQLLRILFTLSIAATCVGFIIISEVLKLDDVMALFFVPQGLNFSVNFSNNSDTIFDSKRLNRKRLFPNRVPMLVHYTYKDIMLPGLYESFLESCIRVNPGVRFLFWSDIAVRRFVELHFPHKLGIYDSYASDNVEKLRKSDFIRPFLLYKYGGIYMDLDNLCNKPFSSVMNQSSPSCMLTQDIDLKVNIMYDMELLAMNSLMACVPRHRFFRLLMDSMPMNNRGIKIFYSTGPFFLTNFLIAYRRNNTAVSDEVVVGDWRQFSPFFGEISLDRFCFGVSMNTPWRHKGCQKLARYKAEMNANVANAVVVHRFLHLGYSGYTKFIKSTFNISKFQNRVTIISHSISKKQLDFL